MKKVFIIFKIEEITIPNPDRRDEWLTLTTHTEWDNEGHETMEQAESVLDDIFDSEPVKHRESVFTIMPIFTRL